MPQTPLTAFRAPQSRKFIFFETSDLSLNSLTALQSPPRNSSLYIPGVSAPQSRKFLYCLPKYLTSAYARYQPQASSLRWQIHSESGLLLSERRPLSKETLVIYVSHLWHVEFNPRNVILIAAEGHVAETASKVVTFTRTVTETTKTVTRHPSATPPATAQFQSAASNTAPNAALQANPSVIHQATATPPALPKKGSGSVRTRPATEGGIWAYIPPHPDEIEPLEPINQRIYVISRGEEVGIFNTWCVMFSFLLPLAHRYLKA